MWPALSTIQTLTLTPASELLVKLNTMKHKLQIYFSIAEIKISGSQQPLNFDNKIFQTLLLPKSISFNFSDKL